jgi:hypothetical protein
VEGGVDFPADDEGGNGLCQRGARKMSLTKPFTVEEERATSGCIQHLAGNDELLPE